MTREVWKSIKTPNALKWPPLPFAASGSQNISSFLLGKSWIWNGPRRRVAAAWINHQHASGSPILGCKYRKHILWLLTSCTFLKEIHCDIVVVCNTNLRFQNMSLLGLRGVILMFRTICLSSAYISNKSPKKIIRWLGCWDFWYNLYLKLVCSRNVGLHSIIIFLRWYIVCF